MKSMRLKGASSLPKAAQNCSYEYTSDLAVAHGRFKFRLRRVLGHQDSLLHAPTLVFLDAQSLFLHLLQIEFYLIVVNSRLFLAARDVFNLPC